MNNEPTVEDIEARADELLRSPDLLCYINDVIHQELVGETTNSLHYFFTLLSTKTKHPANVRMSGLSSQGKTFPLTCVLKVFPREMLHTFMGLTKKSLFYMDPEIDEDGAKIINLRNKCLILLEEDQSDELLDVIKPILSHDQERLVYRPVEKKGNTHTTLKIVLEGWPSYIGLTTKTRISDEQSTRTLLSSPDICPEKYSAVVDRMADEFIEPLKHEVDEDQYLIIQTLIRKLNSDINVFAPQMALVREHFPTNEPRSMRDWKALESIFRTVVTLHQFQRPRFRVGGKEFVFAMPVDFYITLHVLKNSIEDTLTGFNRDAREYYQELLDREDGSWYTNKELHKIYNDKFQCNISRSTFDERVKNLLVNEGCLDKNEEEKVHRYLVVKKDLSHLSDKLKQFDLFFSADLKDYSREKLHSTGNGEIERGKMDKIIEDVFSPYSVESLKKVLERTKEQEYPKKIFLSNSGLSDKSSEEEEEESSDSGVDSPRVFEEVVK